MAVDPLYAPLGLGPTPRPPRRRRGWLLPGAVVLVAAVVAGGWMLRGRTTDTAVVVAPIETAPRTVAAAAAPAAVAPPAVVAAAAPPGEAGGTSVEVQNGVKIIRFNAPSPGSISIPVAEAGAGALKLAPDLRVSEAFPWGTLPRIGANGLRPVDVYARPAGATSGPRVALILAGMGADQAGTANAARRLPAAVDFAYRSDVADAAAQVGETRRAGHEVLLLLGTAAALPPVVAAGSDAATPSLEPLHRQMARFAGYVGVVVDEGVTASDDERGDIAARGLLLLDAAKAARDPAATMAPDVRADAGQGHVAVRDVLTRLAGLARTKGTAVGLVVGGAAAADDIVAVAAAFSDQGVSLVPLSALGARKPDVARATK